MSTIAGSLLRYSSLVKSALFTGVSVGLLCTGQAQAFVVSVNGQNWDVTTFTSPYFGRGVQSSTQDKFAPPPLGVMPWWQNPNLASQFAAALAKILPKTGAPSPALVLRYPLVARSFPDHYSLMTLKPQKNPANQH